MSKIANNETTSNLAELRAAYNATTPGKWRMCDGERPQMYVAALGDTVYVDSDTSEMIMSDTSEADAEFIALAHNAMPSLLEAAESLKLAIKALNTAPRFKIPSLGIDSYQLVSQLEGVSSKLGHNNAQMVKSDDIGG